MKKNELNCRKVARVVLWGLLLAKALIAPAWGQSLDWATQAGGDDNDAGRSIAVDKTGNSYVIGSFSGTATFGPDESNETELISFGKGDIFVAKYASDGSLLWVRQVGGEDDDFGRGIAVDDEGNSYVTGSFDQTATFDPGGANETTLTSFVLETADDTDGFLVAVDLFVAKFNSEGSLTWVIQAGGTSWLSDVAAAAIAVDDAGNSYITGGLAGAVVAFGRGEPNETILESDGDYQDIFVAKYDENGKLLWAKDAHGGIGADAGLDVALDGAGNCYLVGVFEYEVSFGAGGPNHTILGTPDGEPLSSFLAKYSSDGSFLWAKKGGGDGISVDMAGNIYVTGGFSGTRIFSPGGDNETVLTSFGQEDSNINAFIAKYTCDGSLIWVSQAGGLENAAGSSVAVDKTGNSYVIGSFSGTATFGPGESNETELISFGKEDIFVAKYASDGSLLWIIQVEGSENDIGASIAIDAAINIYITGRFQDSVTFGSGNYDFQALTSFGNFDLFVAKYTVNTIQNLIGIVEGLDLNRGIKISMNSKLKNAIKSLEADNKKQRQNAANLLEAFISEVEAKRGNGLTEEQADQLTEIADMIIAEIENAPLLQVHSRREI